MPIFIDRRLNPKDKSLGNRQRFLRRARDELKRSIRDQVRTGKISDVDAAHTVSMPDKGTNEPRFSDAKDSGRRQHVLPGNKHFSPGDRIQKPPQGGGGASRPGNKPSEDDFHFVLSREEVLDLFFEDLELPDMVKLNLKEIVAFKPRRAGYTVTGASTNINVGRTMRNSHGRRIALKRPKREDLEAVEREIAALEAGPSSAEARQKIAELQVELERLERRRRVIAFVDPIDIRFNRFDPQPVPNANAVMFCLMDVSGSMGEREKDLAKRFFVLLHLFLKRRYDRTEIVFIRHTHEAQEVDEETFFYSTQSGGTIVSTALEEMRRVIDERYPAKEWNIYAAQASDGDNSYSDGEVTSQLLTEMILPVTQFFAYLEVGQENGLSYEMPNSSLWTLYESLRASGAPLSMRKVNERSEIFPVFHDLFQRRGPQERTAS
jgi:uncharacterized protein